MKQSPKKKIKIDSEEFGKIVQKALKGSGRIKLKNLKKTRKP